MIPYGHQHLDDSDRAAVLAVLDGDWLTQGPHIEAFEDALTTATQARHAVAFSSGTAALHAAAAVSGLAPGDVGVTSPLSFVASANCLRYVGAGVRFVDVMADTLNIDLSRVPRDVDAVVVVHYAGLPVPLDDLSPRPRVVIEDAAHALGASTAHGPVGNCAFSDMCVFSFHPVKTVTTGEGGAVTTNSPELAKRLREFRNHGMVRKPELGGWYYEVESIGFNYRLTDLQAALGTSQLGRMHEFVGRRNELARRYHELLNDVSVELPVDPPTGTVHARHLFPIQIDDRRRVFEGLRQAGIGAQVHYVPIYRHPIYRESDPSAFPNTERAYARLLSLPLYPGLTNEDQVRVVKTLASLV